MAAEDAQKRFWTITAIDRPGALPVRMAHYDEHRSYLNQADIEIVMAGPMVADDGETPTGSFFVVSCETRDEAANFNKGDPFHRNDVWGDIRITQFLKRRG